MNSELPIVQIDLPTGFIDLGMGNPDLSLLPLDSIQQAANSFFAKHDPRPLQYGVEQGDGFFRRALADFLTKNSTYPVEPESLFVTSGASSALNLICNLYTRPGDVVYAEEPSYFLALRIFEDLGLRVVPIPMDEDGLLLDALEERLSKQKPKLVYTIPTFQNPSGRTLIETRRRKLVELAQDHDFLVVADEVYHQLSYGKMPPPPLALFTNEVEQVISVNSFSKILAPGLRLGWVQAHENVIRRLSSCGMLDSGGGMNPFTSAVVRYLIEAGSLGEHVAALQGEFKSRLTVMDEALRRYIPDAEYTRPGGGFFFWVRLPDMDTAVLRSKVKEFDVDYRPGALFSSENGMKDYVRLSFAVYGAQEIDEGVKRLSDCLALR